LDATCGLYQQSHGQKCEHNHISGPLAAAFVLRCLRQRLLAPSLYSKLQHRLRELAAEERKKGSAVDAEGSSQIGLDQVRREIKQAERNLAFASSQENFQAVEGIITELRKREQTLAAQQAASDIRIRSAADEESEVDAALKVLDRLAELATGGGDYALAREAFELANAKFFLKFEPVRKMRRTVNMVAGGVVTLGAASLPLELYRGPTSRKAIKRSNSGASSGVKKKGGRRSPANSDPQSPGGAGSSLGNVNRGDRI
jgi:hypothetical protein